MLISVEHRLEHKLDVRSMCMKQIKASQVFVVGGMPSATYVPRDHLGIEEKVKEWEEGSHTSLLSVSGPTKTGKTVLLKRFFSDAIWLSGGALESAEEFWQAICDELEVFTEHNLNVSSTNHDSSNLNGTINGVVASLNAGLGGSSENHRGYGRARRGSLKNAARSALKGEKPTIIIDDFHYIPQSEQIKIIRGLKDLIFEGQPVILLAVPHRAYDAIRVEKEMTGRVDNISLGGWDEQDLVTIATLGFQALSVDVSEAIASRLAKESFGSPHLMQAHCLALARSLKDGVSEVSEPEWTEFFRARAAAASKNAFDLLKQGPRQRNDRIIRMLRDGVQTDIYGAVLAAIASTGPRTSLQYEEVRGALKEVLDSDLPQRHEITNILDQMTKIAREKIPGEPVLEFDNEYSTLYIADPFFAYYLRWAPESLKELDIPS